jgi:hypothetical protein
MRALIIGLIVSLAACKGSDSDPVDSDTVGDSDTDGAIDTEDTDVVDTEDTDAVDTDVAPTDADADGFEADADCDDADADVHPGAPERCNAVDDDCDETTSEAGSATIGSTVYATVDAALAASASGDTIEVCPGDITATWVIVHDLTLLSPDSALTVVHAASGPAIAVLAGANADIEGFTLTDGTGYDVGGTFGGGLYVAGDLMATDLVIAGNTADFGGGVAVVGGSAVLDHVAITDDQSTGSGGGVYLADGEVDLVDSMVTGNGGSDGGGVYAYADTVLRITRTPVDRNHAGIGGGVYVSSGVDVIVDGGSVSANGATDEGGGLFAESGVAFVLSGVEVADNAAPYGGGMSLNDGTRALIDGGRIVRNLADGYAGGVRMSASTLSADTVDFGTGGDDNVGEDLRIIDSGAAYSGLGTVSLVCDAVSCL